MDRLIHMALWGIEYSVFSLSVVFIYRILLKSENGRVVLSLGKFQFYGIQLSDFVIFSILTILAAIRCNVGSDYYNYYTYFNTVLSKYGSLKEVFSDTFYNGYNAISYIVKQFSDNEYIIFAVIAIIVYAALFSMIRNESDDCEVSLACFMLLGFYANSLNIIKQYFSMTFLMMAYFALKNRKNVKALFFCTFGLIFHYSAFIVLILYIIIRRLEPKKILLRSVWIVGIAIGVISPNILTFVLRLIPTASGYLKYINWSRNSQVRLLLAVVGSCIVYSIICYLIIRRKEEIRELSEDRYREIVFLLVGLLINIVGIRMWVIARISFYFYMFAVFIIPTYLRTFDKSKRKKVRTLLYLLLFVYSVFINIYLGENEYYSYSTIWQTTPMNIPTYNALNGFLK